MPSSVSSAPGLRSGVFPGGGGASPRPAVETRTEVVRVLARHALGWLVAGNAVGLLLSALLLWPGLNGPLAPLTYGRWVPLHLDGMLYGWGALPLVGALLAWFLDARHPRAVAHTRIALGAWSLALALGGGVVLGGVTSGKMFLESSGWARPLLPAAMLLLWTILAAHGWWRRQTLGRGGLVARLLVLLALLLVPGALYWTAGREVYPQVNPDSGGATGARLLASTLGIVAIYGFLAEILGLSRPGRRNWFWGYFVFSAGVFIAIERGSASHHVPAQFFGLATLLGWLPLMGIYFRGGAGAPEARRWWAAAFVWWVALVGSGLWTFLPGVSERLKFTNGMVAHAHLAMAGLVTSANLAVLAELRPRLALRHFWRWQGACVLHVGVLLALGWVETDHAAELFLAAPWTQAFYAARLAAGAVMLLAAVQWWWSAVGRKGAEQS